MLLLLGRCVQHSSCDWMMPLVLLQKLWKVDLHLKNKRVTFDSVVLALSLKILQPNQQLKKTFLKNLCQKVSKSLSFFVQKLRFFKKTMEQKQKQLLATAAIC